MAPNDSRYRPDGKLAALNTNEQGMRLVLLENGEVVRSIGTGQAHSYFAFDPHGERIAVCGSANVQIIDANTGAVTAVLPTVIAIEPQLAWHPGGQFLAVWADNSVAIWDVEQRKKVQVLLHRGLPSRLTFNSDGSILATETAWNNRMVVWNVGTGQRLLEGSGRFHHAAEAMPDGGLLFLTLNSRNVDVWELTTGACNELAQVARHAPGLLGQRRREPGGAHYCFLKPGVPRTVGRQVIETTMGPAIWRLHRRVRC